MEYHHDHDQDSGICTVYVSGDHKRPDDSIILQEFARDFGREHGCIRFLFDMTNAVITGEFMDTFKVGTVPRDAEYEQIKQKTALLYSSLDDEIKFMEDVAVNRGYQLKVFDQREEAINWLKSSK